MASTKRLDGRDLMLFRVGADGLTEAKAFACAKSCSLSVTSNFDEISDKDTSAFNEVDLKNITFEMSSSNLMTSTAEAYDLIEEQLAGKKFAVLFALAQNASKSAVEDVNGKKWTPVTEQNKCDGFFGSVMIASVSINASSDGKAELSVSLKGAGELKRVAKETRPT